MSVQPRADVLLHQRPVVRQALDHEALVVAGVVDVDELLKHLLLKAHPVFQREADVADDVGCLAPVVLPRVRRFEEEGEARRRIADLEVAQAAKLPVRLLDLQGDKSIAANGGGQAGPPES